MPVTAVLISCRQRDRARELTIPQLQAVGINPRVFLDECILTPEKTELGNKWIGERALRWALEQHPTRPILFLEDDIDLAPDFPNALDMAVSANLTTYMYINEQHASDNQTYLRMERLYGPRLADQIRRGEPTRMRLKESKSYVGLYGTQAVFIPVSVAHRLLDEWLGRSRKAFDAALQLCLEGENLPALIAVPNVVQHRHDRTAREPEKYMKRSRSFECPREEPDAEAA